MVATMYAADGVGLAACQIGVDRSIFVFDCPDEDGTMVQGVVCNPVVYLPEGKDRRLDDGDEGCLSFPGAFVPCARPDYAEVRGQGLDGSPVAVRRDGVARPVPAARDRPLPRDGLRGPAPPPLVQEAGEAARGRGRGVPARLAGGADRPA